LLVCASADHGREVIRQMGGSLDSRVCGDYRIVWPGVGLAGFRADMILITSDARWKRNNSRDAMRDWWDRDLPLRLHLDGKIVNL
jgi:hypothetical protein